MEWYLLREKLSEFNCPMIEQLDELSLQDSLSNLTGDLRFSFLEWLFHKYEPSYNFSSNYTEFSKSTEFDTEKFVFLGSALGINSNRDIILGNCENEIQKKFFFQLIEMIYISQETELHTQFLTDMSLLKEISETPELFSTKPQLFLNPEFETKFALLPSKNQVFNGVDTKKLQNALLSSKKKLQQIKIELENLFQEKVEEDFQQENENCNVDFNFIKLFVESIENFNNVFREEIEPWTKDQREIQFLPIDYDKLQKIHHSFKILDQMFSHYEIMDNSLAIILNSKLDKFQKSQDWESSLFSLQDNINILEKSLQRKMKT